MSKLIQNSILVLSGTILSVACAKEPAADDSAQGVAGIEWPEGVPPEALEDVDCSTPRCLSIQEGSTYCSVDPPGLAMSGGENGFFATKSMITLPAGTYPLRDPPFMTTIPVFPVVVATRFGSATMTPQNPLGLYYEILPPEVEGDVTWQWESFHTMGGGMPDSAFVGEGIDASWLGLNVTNIDLWPDRHFRTGDPKDAWWWYQATRRIVLSVARASAAFPGIMSYEEIHYSPCDFTGMPDEVFSFESLQVAIDLTVRSASGSSVGWGYYAPRLIAASGTFAGEPVEITSFWDLAASHASDDSAKMMPEFAVRTAYEGEHCGFFFSPHYWEPDGWTDWKAFYLDCDERPAEEIPLVSVTTPPGYQSW